MTQIETLREAERRLSHAIDVARPLDMPRLIAALEAALQETCRLIQEREAAEVIPPPPVE